MRSTGSEVTAHETECDPEKSIKICQRIQDLCCLFICFCSDIDGAFFVYPDRYRTGDRSHHKHRKC